jgi:hypothetical protein
LWLSSWRWCTPPPLILKSSGKNSKKLILKSSSIVVVYVLYVIAVTICYRNGVMHATEFCDPPLCLTPPPGRAQTSLARTTPPRKLDCVPCRGGSHTRHHFLFFLIGIVNVFRAGVGSFVSFSFTRHTFGRTSAPSLKKKNVIKINRPRVLVLIEEAQPANKAQSPLQMLYNGLRKKEGG